MNKRFKQLSHTFGIIKIILIDNKIQIFYQKKHVKLKIQGFTKILQLFY